MVEKNGNVVSDDAPNSCDSSVASGCSTNAYHSKLNTMPYRLTEQFVINVQKDAKPTVRFHSASLVDLRFFRKHLNQLINF